MLRLEQARHFSKKTFKADSVIIDNLFKIESAIPNRQLTLRFYLTLQVLNPNKSGTKPGKIEPFNYTEEVKEVLEKYKLLVNDDRGNSTLNCNFVTCDWFPTFNVIDLLTAGETEIEFNRNSVNEFIRSNDIVSEKIHYNSISRINYDLYIFFSSYKCKISLMNNDLNSNDLLNKVLKTFKV